MAAWMEEDDALELQDYLRGLHSRCKGGDVDWKAVMEGRSTLGGDRKGARGLELGGGLSASPQIEAKGGNRFLKGRNHIAKGSKERKSDSVSSKASSHFTKLSAKGFLKDNSLSPSASDRSRTSSSVSSLLSDDLLGEREDQPVARAAPLARTSLHSDEYSLDSTEEETRPSVASDCSSPQPWRDKSSSSLPSTPSEVAVELPRVQFVSDMASLSSVIPDQVATADSVTEQLSSVATEVRHSEGVLRSGQGSMPGGEEGCYDDDTFEDVSVLDDGHVEHRPVSHQSDLVEHEYGDSDFEESIVESPNSSDEQTSTEDEEREDEVDDVEDDNDDGSDDDGSTESRDAFTETLGSVVVEQTKEVPSKRPLAKTSSIGVQTLAFTMDTVTPPPPSLSVLHSLLTMPTIGAAGSLHPPSAAVLDDLLRQHIHLARQSMDFTRAVAGRIEANLNTNHKYTTLQDTHKFIAACKPLPVHRRRGL